MGLGSFVVWKFWLSCRGLLVVGDVWWVCALGSSWGDLEAKNPGVPSLEPEHLGFRLSRVLPTCLTRDLGLNLSVPHLDTGTNTLLAPRGPGRIKRNC